MPIKTVAEAIHDATLQLLNESSDCFVIGEGLGDMKRAFGTVPKHERVFDMPVSENGMTGVCIGAAVSGMRPIMVHMRADFLLYAADQIINNAAKWWGMFGGQAGSCPLVIRAVIGRGWGQGMQHSQHLERMFSEITGLEVMCPSNAYDAKGMLIAAVRNPNPVLYLEHRWIHELKCDVPDDMYEIDGSPEVLSTGKINLSAWGYMVHECVAAAKIIKDQTGIAIGVKDWKRPMRGEWVIEEESCCPPSFALSRGFYPTANSIALELAECLGETIEVTDPEFHDIPNPDFRGPF